MTITFSTPFFSTGFDFDGSARPGFQIQGYGSGSYKGSYRVVKPAMASATGCQLVDTVWFPNLIDEAEAVFAQWHIDDSPVVNTWLRVWYDPDIRRVRIASNAPFKIQFPTSPVTGLTVAEAALAAELLGFNVGVEYTASAYGSDYAVTAWFDSPYFFAPRVGFASYDIRSPRSQHRQVRAASGLVTTEYAGRALATCEVSFEHLRAHEVMRYHDTESAGSDDRQRHVSWQAFIDRAQGGRIVALYDHRRVVVDVQTLAATSDNDETKIASSGVAQDTLVGFDMHVIDGHGIGQHRSIASQTYSSPNWILAPTGWASGGGATWDAEAPGNVGGVPVEGSTIALVRRGVYGWFDAQTLNGETVRRMGSRAEFFSVSATLAVYNWS